VALGTLGIWLISDPGGLGLRSFFNLSPPLVKFLEFPNGYYGYYFAGGVFKLFPEASRKTTLLSALVYVSAVSLTVYGSVRALYVKGLAQEMFAHQQSIFVAFQSLSLFLLLRKLGETSYITDNASLCRGLRSLSEQSYGIYLIHITVVHYTALNFFNQLVLHVGVKIMAHVVVVTVVSYCLSWAFKKIPVIREVVP